MVAECDLALLRKRGVGRHVSDGQPVLARHGDGLIEVAVVQRPVPRHRKLRAAHHRRQRFRIERIDQLVHVAIHVVRLQQALAETPAGRIRDREQAV